MDKLLKQLREAYSLFERKKYRHPQEAGKKGVRFIRWGSTNPTKQKGYKANITIDDDDAMSLHAPPARRGFYAFVWPYVERFLLGGREEMDPRRMEWVKDEEGNLIPDEDFDWDNPRNEKYFAVRKNTKGKNYADFKGELLDRMLKPLQDKLEAGEISQDEYDKESEKVRDEYNDKAGKRYVAKHKKPTQFTYSGDIWHKLVGEVSQKDVIDRNGAWVKTTMPVYKKALNKTLGKIQQEVRREGYGSSASRGFLDHLEVFIERL